MTEIKIFAPAKINLYLAVLRQLRNGYHAIDSVMQTVSLCDIVTLRPLRSGIRVSSNKKISNTLFDNLAFKAAELFFRVRPGIKYGVEINIDKNIPMSAGLGGGSADAAAVLVGLNLMFHAKLTEQELCALGLSLGADVPFCLMGGTQRARGIGEIITACPPLPDCELLLAIGDETVNTRWAYGELDKLGLTEKFTAHRNGVAEMLGKGSLSEICSKMYNSFEEISNTSETIKNLMLSGGAVGALMSGSGPAVFGVYDSIRSRDVSALTLSALGYRVFPCKAMS
jgi:4-diphosphocytidyl-2-C-methyl-D-erythritol kinase